VPPLVMGRATALCPSAADARDVCYCFLACVLLWSVPGAVREAVTAHQGHRAEDKGSVRPAARRGASALALLVVLSHRRTYHDYAHYLGKFGQAPGGSMSRPIMRPWQVKQCRPAGRWLAQDVNDPDGAFPSAYGRRSTPCRRMSRVPCLSRKFNRSSSPFCGEYTTYSVT